METLNLKDKIKIGISVMALVVASAALYTSIRSNEATSHLNAMITEPQLFLFSRIVEVENVTDDTFLIAIEGFLQNRGAAFCVIECLSVDPYVYETRLVTSRHGGRSTRMIRTQVEDYNLSLIEFDPLLTPLNTLDKDSSHNFTFSISVPRWALRTTSAEFFIDLCFLYSFSSSQHKRIVTYESPHQTLGGLHVSGGAGGDW